MNKLYYSITHELQRYDDNLPMETTGNKEVYVYTVVDEDIELLFKLDLLTEDNSEESIKEYIEDELNKDTDNIELIEL